LASRLVKPALLLQIELVSSIPGLRCVR
jgi:hypothetical protein